MSGLAILPGTWSLAFRLARRELRGGLGGLVVFLACLVIGVAAITAVGVVNESVSRAISADARALLGGDVSIETTNRPVPEEQLAALLPADTPVAATVRTNAMVESLAGRFVAVSLKAVAPAYPLLGEVGLEPPMPLAQALTGHGMVAEASLLARLGVAVGDRVKLGDLEVTLKAVLTREPDRVGGIIGFGPRVLVGEDTLAAARILMPGALAEFSYRALLPPGSDVEAMVQAMRLVDPDAAWRIRTSDDVQPQVARFTNRLATYLTLAGLTALLTGGLGVALAVEGFLRARSRSIATFKCIGATSRQIFWIYLVQIMALAAIGVLIGLVLGQALPLLTQLLPPDILPVRLGWGVYPGPLLTAAAAGFLTALVFAIWPLAMARETSAAGLFRTLVAPVRRLPRPGYLLLLAAAIAALALLAIMGSAQRMLGLWFVLIAAVSAVLLTLLAQGLISLLRRLGRQGRPSLRLALANIHRPGSGASSVIIALGAGLAVLTMVAILQTSLLAEIGARVAARAPSVVLIDIQPDQVAPLHAIVQAVPGARITQEAPTLRARVVRIGGQSVVEAAVAENVRWTVQRDRALSYSAAMPPGTELVAGSWWPEDYRGPPLVSAEDEVAYGYGLKVGDKIGFNILGRVVEAEIANLRREIDWSSGRLDFVFILSPGVLEGAPHTRIAAIDLPAEAEAGLIQTLAEQLPNVTPISIREVVAQLGEVMGRIALAVQVVAGVTLATGVLVLSGAVAAARQRHRYQAVVLKVLGARRSEVLRLFLLEYLALGLAAAIAGMMLGTIGAWVVLAMLLDLPFTLSPLAVLVVTSVAIGLALAAAGVGIWRALGQSAASVLRTP